jgi:hypothetical protein
VLADGVFAHLQKEGKRMSQLREVETEKQQITRRRRRKVNRRTNLGEELRLVCVGLFVELLGEALDRNAAFCSRGGLRRGNRRDAVLTVNDGLCLGFLEHFGCEGGGRWGGGRGGGRGVGV